jgi:hypothetical protein
MKQELRVSHKEKKCDRDICMCIYIPYTLEIKNVTIDNRQIVESFHDKICKIK